MDSAFRFVALVSAALLGAAGLYCSAILGPAGMAAVALLAIAAALVALPY